MPKKRKPPKRWNKKYNKIIIGISGGFILLSVLCCCGGIIAPRNNMKCYMCGYEYYDREKHAFYTESRCPYCQSSLPTFLMRKKKASPEEMVGVDATENMLFDMAGGRPKDDECFPPIKLNR